MSRERQAAYARAARKNPEYRERERRYRATRPPILLKARNALSHLVVKKAITKPIECSRCGSEVKVYAFIVDFVRVVEGLRWFCWPCHKVMSTKCHALERKSEYERRKAHLLDVMFWDAPRGPDLEKKLAAQMKKDGWW